jgi:hypothetical protein
MMLSYLALARRRDRVAGMVAGACTGTIFIMRPGDLIYGWPLMTTLWLDCRGLLDARRRATWFLAGAVPPVATVLYFSFAIHGGLISRLYRVGVVGSGFGPGPLGVKLYTFLIDGFHLFSEPRTLVTAFPFLLFVLPGIVVFIKEFKKEGALIVTTQAGAVAYFLLYRDYWISEAFKFGAIRYWLWLFPFAALYAYISLRLAWRKLGWIPTSLLLVLPVFAWLTPRMNIHPVKWELSGTKSNGLTTMSRTSGANSGNRVSWTCKPGPPDGSCSMSVVFARPVEFDTLVLRGIAAVKLLYSRVLIDGKTSPILKDHYVSDGVRGQTYVIFYNRKKSESIGLTIPPGIASSQISISDFELAERHIGLALQNPLRRYHPELY